MKTCILTANLGGFDRVKEPKDQSVDCDYHCFADKDFPPIKGLSPRLQYRIPKTHGWQMKPGYDVYLWLDASMTLDCKDCVEWFLNQLETYDIALFRHPDRQTARQETNYIEKKKDHPYIKSRYENGLHEEQMKEIEATGYEDETLYASTVFVYRNNMAVREMMKEWLYSSVRYYTCDQIVLPYLLWKYGLTVKMIDQDVFKNSHVKVVSRHL